MSANKLPSIKSFTVDFIDAKQAGLGLSDSDLAADCLWNLRGFQSQRVAGFPCVRLQLRIEAALGFCSVWSSDLEVQLRCRCFSAHGIDPAVCTLVELEGLCRRLGVRSPSIRRREAWYDALMSSLAANPAMKARNRV